MNSGKNKKFITAGVKIQEIVFIIYERYEVLFKQCRLILPSGVKWLNNVTN